MIKIIKTKAVIDFNHKDVLRFDKCVVFDKKVIKICSFKSALKDYKNAEVIDKSDYILSPVLINLHAHLEFSLSKLFYGDFVEWLESIIYNREKIDKDALEAEINRQINLMQKSGIGYLGEISSFGAELDCLEASSLKSIVFHEILGANDEAFKNNSENFLKRFQSHPKLNNHISLHSPYSICKKTYDFATNFARKNDLYISTHYLESSYEEGFLAGEQNALTHYLKRFNPEPIEFDFLKDFADLKALFTHCNYVEDFSRFSPQHIITTCPRSNRYLGSRAAKLNKMLKSRLRLSLGTDGLSSNESLNMFDELRAALLVHTKLKLNPLASKLYKAACWDCAPLFTGGFYPLTPGAPADFILLSDFGFGDSDLLTQIILRTKEVQNMYMDGELII